MKPVAVCPYYGENTAEKANTELWNPHYWHENVVILHMSVHKTLCLFLGKFIFHSGLSIILRFYCSVLAILSFTVEITGILNKLLAAIVG